MRTPSARYLLLAMSVSIIACYNPDYQGAHFPCATDSDCPTDFICSAKSCRASAQTVAPAPSDPACKNGGVQVGTGVHACHGDFGTLSGMNLGDFAALCADGFQPCDDPNKDLLGGINAQTCAAVGGFYVAHLAASLHMGNGALQCGQGFTKILVGCGSGDGTQSFSGDCDHLTVGLRCDGAKAPWQCQTVFGQILDSTSHHATDGSGGLLCCQK